MKNVPTHLKHSPVVAVDYEKIDENAGAGDAMSLSIGVATWNNNKDEDKRRDYSAKIFRKVDSTGRWSPQSEELPLWRVLDLAALVIAVIQGKPSGLDEKTVCPEKIDDLHDFIKRNNNIYQEKINNLRKLLNK